jgi:hypothetical protein
VLVCRWVGALCRQGGHTNSTLADTVDRHLVRAPASSRLATHAVATPTQEEEEKLSQAVAAAAAAASAAQAAEQAGAMDVDGEQQLSLAAQQAAAAARRLKAHKERALSGAPRWCVEGWAAGCVQSACDKRARACSGILHPAARSRRAPAMCACDM